jgi:hypothetical protein
MNNIQLNEVLKTDRYTKKNFIGCFPLDKLPKIINYPSCMIVNNKKSDNIGEHWIAIYFDSKKRATFFDSFGLHPRYYKLQKYLKQYSSSFAYNHKQIQSIFSDFCGYYCILFLLFKARKKSLNFISKSFKNPIVNDNLIQNLINNHE